MTETLADRIRARLRALDWTQQRLEQEAGLSKGYVSRVLSGDKGERTSGAHLSNIARALGVSLEWLLKGGDTPAPVTVAVPREVSEDPCPKRTRAAAIALEDGIPVEAIARVMAMPADPARTTFGWLREMVRIASPRVDDVWTMQGSEEKPG
jgi:transcriptional regulator with XRE-family HTH domain